ncbi:MAG: RHS repeat-associated core domain-containing protein [Planctomycetota bacterium]
MIGYERVSAAGVRLRGTSAPDLLSVADSSRFAFGPPGVGESPRSTTAHPGVAWVTVLVFAMVVGLFGTATANVIKPWETDAGVMDGGRPVRADGRDAPRRHPVVSSLDESAPPGLRASGASSTPALFARPVLVVVWRCTTTQLKKESGKRDPTPALPAIGSCRQFSPGMRGGGCFTRYPCNAGCTEMTDAAGTITQWTYCQKSFLTQVVEDVGTSHINRTTTYTYDLLGHRATEVDAASVTTAYQYDTAYRLTGVTRDSGGKNVTENMAYDSLGRVTSRTDAGGNQTTFLYDQLSRTTQESRPDGGVTTFAYDNLANVLTKSVKVTSAPTWFTTTYTYDDVYRQTQMTEDSAGLAIVTNRTYDALHRLTRLQAVNGAQNQNTDYAYDDENHVVQETYPDSGTVSFSYDLDGKLTTKTDQKGQVTTFEYNSRDLLTSKVYDDGGSNEGTQTFSYDSLRRMTENTDDNSGNKDVTATFEYDLLSRMTEEGLQIGSSGTTRYTTKTYDAFGQIQTRTQPSGREVDYTWTTLHQPHEIKTDVGSGLATVADYAYLYDSGNDKRPLLATKTLHSGTGVTLNVAYDSVGRSTNYNWLKNSTSQVGFANTYDLAGNRLTTTHLHRTNGTEDEEFGYDTALRLTSYVRNPTAQDPFDQTFNLDKVANWTSFVEEGTTEYRTHSIANELTARDSTSLTHDANGSQTSDGTFAFEWDALNRQKAMRNGSTLRAEYFYTADNRRVVKNVDTNSDGTLDKETKFYFDGNVIIEDRDGSDTLAREYVNGLQYIDEVILVKQAGGTINYYLHDPRFSVFGFTDTSGNVTERYNYTAYGKQAIFDASYNSRNTPTVDQERGHTGQTEDREGPLQHFDMRYYNPAQGRFISQDIEYLDGMNLYGGYFVPGDVDLYGLNTYYAETNEEKEEIIHAVALKLEYPDNFNENGVFTGENKGKVKAFDKGFFDMVDELDDDNLRIIGHGQSTWIKGKEPAIIKRGDFEPVTQEEKDKVSKAEKKLKDKNVELRSCSSKEIGDAAKKVFKKSTVRSSEGLHSMAVRPTWSEGKVTCCTRDEILNKIREVMKKDTSWADDIKKIEKDCKISNIKFAYEIDELEENKGEEKK